MTLRNLGGALVVLGAALPAAAQEQGNPAAGRELASQLCSSCHIVGTEAVGSDAAPPFPVIAEDPTMTITGLHAWVEPGHPVLPNLALTPKQIADINAYLDSLRGPAEDEPPRIETEAPPPQLEQAPPEKLGEPIEPQPE